MNNNDEDSNSTGDDTTTYTTPAASNNTTNFKTQNQNITRSTFGNNMSFSPVNTLVNPIRLIVNMNTRGSITKPTPIS